MLDLESRVAALERSVEGILKRNQQVELNKAWETSNTRLFSIIGITYITMVSLFTALNSDNPFLHALVPTAGFSLSTLSLPLVRRYWEQRLRARND